jgi:hypothetical protein
MQLEENEKLQRGVEELLKLKEEPHNNTDTTGEDAWHGETAHILVSNLYIGCAVFRL